MLIKMRKLIIKYFALNYIFTYKNKLYSYVRASTPITIAFCTMVLLVSDADYPILSGNDFISLGLLITALFFGFVYFSHFPVKYNELDESQKWQYGNYVQKEEMSQREYMEWLIIDAKQKNQKQTLPLAINIITVVATILFIYYNK